MISYCSGDIFESQAEAIVKPVNCVGVMGKGLALQFKERFPGNYEIYKAACARGELVPGRMLVVDAGPASPRFIVNFPTKRHWRDKSRLSDIEEGLLALVRDIHDRRIRSIALPALGAGLGGLDWNEVRRRIDNALGAVPDVDIVVYEPEGPKQ